MSIYIAVLCGIKFLIQADHAGPIVPVPENIAGGICKNQVILCRDSNIWINQCDLYDLKLIIIIVGSNQTDITYRKAGGRGKRHISLTPRRGAIQSSIRFSS